MIHVMSHKIWSGFSSRRLVVLYWTNGYIIPHEDLLRRPSLGRENKKEREDFYCTYWLYGSGLVPNPHAN